jgi:hypothetical protein
MGSIADRYARLPSSMERLVLTARLIEGAQERGLELAAGSTDPGARGFDRFSVYLSESEVVFLFEAPDAERLVRGILNDPVQAAELSPWLPLFDGPLHRAPEIYHWSRAAHGHS